MPTKCIPSFSPPRFVGDEVRLGERRQRYVGPQYLPGFRAPRPADLGTHPARVLLGSGLAGEGELDSPIQNGTSLFTVSVPAPSHL